MSTGLLLRLFVTRSSCLFNINFVCKQPLCSPEPTATFTMSDRVNSTSIEVDLNDSLNQVDEEPACLHSGYSVVDASNCEAKRTSERYESSPKLQSELEPILQSPTTCCTPCRRSDRPRCGAHVRGDARELAPTRWPTSWWLWPVAVCLCICGLLSFARFNFVLLRDVKQSGAGDFDVMDVQRAAQSAWQRGYELSLIHI